MLLKISSEWCLLFLLLNGFCLSNTAKINISSTIREKYEDIENISQKLHEDAERCNSHQPRIHGLEPIEGSIQGVCGPGGEPVDCLNDVIFYIKNMPHFEDFFCNASFINNACQSNATTTLEMLWRFREDFNNTMWTCNASLSVSEENPLTISCSDCSSGDLFWGGLSSWTDYIHRMLGSLEESDFSQLQTACNEEHARLRKEVKRAQAQKRKEAKRKEAKRKREERKQKKKERRRKEQLKKGRGKMNPNEKN